MADTPGKKPGPALSATTDFPEGVSADVIREQQEAELARLKEANLLADIGELWREKCEAFECFDLDGAIPHDGPKITGPMALAIVGAANGPVVAYWLAMFPRDAAAIARLDRQRQIAAIRQLSADLAEPASATKH